jgi:sterol desaturase/sphingolipid hydroxylase (fatty acid hydroxylase superfamily)
MDLCFVNPTREQLKEYMGLLVEEGFHVNVERWNGKAEGETLVYFTSMLVPGIIALGIVLEVLLWAVQAVRTIMLRREEKRIVLELYGAAPRVIKRNIFLLSSAVVMPGVLISMVTLPLQSWRYLGLEHVQVNLFYVPALKELIVFFAAGIVFSLVVAWGQFSTNSRIKPLRRGM